MGVSRGSANRVSRADLEALADAVGEKVGVVLRKAERLNHRMGVEVLREHAKIWRDRKESVAHIRTADGAAAMAEEMGEAVKTYGGVEEEYDARLMVVDFLKRRGCYIRGEARRAEQAVPALRARVDSADALTPPKRGGLLRSVRHRITVLRREGDFCDEFGLNVERDILEGVIAKYRVLADDLRRGRPG